MTSVRDITASLAQENDFTSQSLLQIVEKQRLIALEFTDIDAELLTKLAHRVAQLDGTWLAEAASAKVLLTLPGLRLLADNWDMWFGVDPLITQQLAAINEQFALIWQVKNKRFDLSQKAMIYAIMNITPDSFFDGGKYQTEAAVLEHVAEMIAAGADVIEVNGQTTRPGFVEVSPEVEINRTIPYIKAIRAEYPDIIIAIDTYKLPVMQAAIEAGVDIINDVNSFEDDPAKLALLGQSDVGLLTMLNARTKDITELTPEMYAAFADNLKLLTNAGIAKERIALDQGIGYSKVPHGVQDYGMMLNVDAFNDFQRPMMIAISRKGYLGNLLGLAKEDRLPMTLVAEALMYVRGGRILRVHDVEETRQLLTLLETIESGYWLG
ncbi:dihydropteroate synthase [Periweissella fabalis]|uniref:Dihydropteroate synthase n=1 Tax=Periweissella fabalis TaxID=1070421 RepID=A0A7X6N125_9LACO|nr:dihydropteroate synthase [Periweissella fabalis]MCM0599541.1 dihydropteroate synthase [Periweissella fabalis]NKZ23846.1 dihydropteroate synthase [Periweissella fabalis]